MKMPIAWYQNNLKNMKISLASELKRLRHEQRRINMMQSDIEVLEEQIKAAIKKGKDGFDQDKFMKKRA